MCGRFMQTREVEELRERFRIREVRAASVQPCNNVAPTMPVPVVREEGGGRVLELHRWGLVPAWAKSLKDGPRPINAKAETLSTSGMFRRLVDNRRCLVIADGFYEWKGPRGKRLPVSIRLAGGAPFAFAGLWELWRDPADGGELRSCTVITCPANALIEPIHDRMPVILRAEDEERWLEPGAGDAALLEALLRPYDPAEMALGEVSGSLDVAGGRGRSRAQAESEKEEEPRQRMLPGFGSRL
jgi:putative SOS response-associated peptidase YedK